MKTCALTGHRGLPADFDRAALAAALERLIQGGCTRFLCGMAMGFDLTALECLVALRERYAITLVACIPHARQPERFPDAEKARYARLLPLCDEQVVLGDHYTDGCMQRRNRYMVDRADVVLAYCRKRSGGTAYTVGYAKRCGKPVIFL